MNTISRMNYSKGNWWVAFFKGVLLVIFGIWLIQSPTENLMKLSLVFGLLILIGGLLEVSFAFNSRKTTGSWEWALISGVFDILIGSFLMANPDFILMLIMTIISIWLIVMGIISVRKALIVKKANNQNYIYRLVLGIVLIALALIFIWHPEVFGITLAFWAAVAFISLGVFRIVLVFKFTSLKKGF